MMIGLIPQNPARMPDAWKYGLGGLAGLRAAFGMGDAQIPPVYLCQDEGGNPVPCTPGSGGSGGTNPCDETFVAMGYTCYLVNGQPTYVPPGGAAPPETPAPAGPPPAGSPTGKAGGSPTGSPTGTCTGANCNTQCLGIFGMTSAGQWICNHKTLLLVSGVVALTLMVRQKV